MATVVSVHVGAEEELGKLAANEVQVELDGVVGAIEVPGIIKTGDEFKIQIYTHPAQPERTCD